MVGKISIYIAHVSFFKISSKLSTLILLFKALILLIYELNVQNTVQNLTQSMLIVSMIKVDTLVNACGCHNYPVQEGGSLMGDQAYHIVQNLSSSVSTCFTPLLISYLN